MQIYAQTNNATTSYIWRIGDAIKRGFVYSSALQSLQQQDFHTTLHKCFASPCAMVLSNSTDDLSVFHSRFETTMPQ